MQGLASDLQAEKGKVRQLAKPPHAPILLARSMLEELGLQERSKAVLMAAGDHDSRGDAGIILLRVPPRGPQCPNPGVAELRMCPHPQLDLLELEELSGSSWRSRARGCWSSSRKRLMVQLGLQMWWTCWTQTAAATGTSWTHSCLGKLMGKEAHVLMGKEGTARAGLGRRSMGVRKLQLQQVWGEDPMGVRKVQPEWVWGKDPMAMRKVQLEGAWGEDPKGVIGTAGRAGHPRGAGFSPTRVLSLVPLVPPAAPAACPRGCGGCQPLSLAPKAAGPPARPIQQPPLPGAPVGQTRHLGMGSWCLKK